MLLVCFLTPTAAGQPLPIASCDDGMWILQPDEDQALRVLHRQVSDPPDQLRMVKILHGGQVAPGGVACWRDRLWVVYKNTPSHPQSAVVSIRSSQQGNNATPASEPKPSLPIGSILRAVAANPSGLWALLRIEKRETLTELDRPNPDPLAAGSAPVSSADHPLPPATPAPSMALQQTTAEDSETLPAARRRIPADRLVTLRHNRWVKVALPDDWPHDTPSWLLMRDDDDPYPLLVTSPKTEGIFGVWVYEYDGTSWSKQRFAPEPPGEGQPTVGPWGPAGPAAAMAMLCVDGQLVLGRIQRDADRLVAGLMILRSGSMIPLGRLELGGSAESRWGLARHGSAVALVVGDPQQPIRWSQMDLRGQLTAAETPLVVSIPNPLTETADYLVFVTVLILATLIMYVVWRRDQSENRLDLPQTLELADLAQRIIAALIDLFPCVILSMVTFAMLPLQIVFNHWPGRSGGWQEMLPGALIIVVFVVHTTVTESIAATTMGKKIMGIQVVTLTGQQPHLWQSLARGGMKVFDLVAWPLLILPVIGPYRQRLGDLVAKTVVVSRVELESGSEEEDSSDPRS